MPEISDLNGNRLASGPEAVLTLELELVTGKLAIGGELQNLDLALNMLAQATRYLEMQYKLQQQMIFEANRDRDQRLLSRVMQ